MISTAGNPARGRYLPSFRESRVASRDSVLLTVRPVTTRSLSAQAYALHKAELDVIR